LRRRLSSRWRGHSPWGLSRNRGRKRWSGGLWGRLPGLWLRPQQEPRCAASDAHDQGYPHDHRDHRKWLFREHCLFRREWCGQFRRRRFSGRDFRRGRGRSALFRRHGSWRWLDGWRSGHGARRGLCDLQSRHRNLGRGSRCTRNARGRRWQRGRFRHWRRHDPRGSRRKFCARRRLRRLTKDDRRRHGCRRTRRRRSRGTWLRLRRRCGSRGPFRRRDWRTHARRCTGRNGDRRLRRLWGGLRLAFNQSRRSSLFERGAALLTKLGPQVQWALAETADGCRWPRRNFRLRHNRWRSFLHPHAALKAEDDIFREFRVAIGAQGHGRCRAQSPVSDRPRLRLTPTGKSYYTFILLSSPACG
jgi:hypothetical protein